MRLVFAGTPEAAVPSLRALASAGHDIPLVVTRPDARLGRKRVLTPSPVAAAAEELGLPTLRTARLDEAATAEILAQAPEMGVVVAYGGLVREPLLSTPPHGWVNLHFSLLPRWRGAAPVQRALIAGDEQTGVSVFRLVPALDAGDLVAVRSVPTPPSATAGDLLTSLADLGADVLAAAVAAVEAGTATFTPQDGEVTLAPKLEIDDGRIDWTRPASEVLDRFRGTTPEPGAHTTVEGARLKIVEARAAHDADRLEPGAIAVVGRAVLVGTATTPLELQRVQPAGKAAMAAGDWWRGARTAEGTVAE